MPAKRPPLYPGSTRELNDLSKAVESTFRELLGEIEKLRNRTVVGGTVSGNGPVSKDQRSYYVDLRKGASALLMPPDPYVGETHVFKDVYARSASSYLTLLGNGNTIEQFTSPGTWSSTLVIATNGACVTLEWDGEHWSIV